MNNTTRVVAIFALAGVALSVVATAHAADPAPVAGPSRLSPDDALVVEAVHTDAWRSGFGMDSGGF
ncbi:hypothetical protein ADK53_15255 [Streptomyces sp. WM6373]|uniref:hypothetical protein n=1 Tax=Streptomyces TaxID=1883 RepID=UPI0006ADE4FE|nr:MULTISPECIES: hypothetical protein [unclassified Streptomyces]KOU34345.1 hypothetical protein ADK53_15255 [Streptomyces sp. WM6373]KOU61408.1 hypothetical protein ADK96_28985 [Streptomyces sp. IGB124]KOU80149.1 hypothetical protein ADK93_33965 [Streptomyces sp. XY58]KOV06449.1 hypothetical protein ADK89_14555 [Streptomyces sp. XY37]KOV46000.1 hypothetical protein ADK97_04420 [Streptomyces sp. H021]